MDREIQSLFKQGNVCVCGERGSGKDMLMANICVRTKKPYLSNINYDRKSKKGKKYYIPLDFDIINIPCSTTDLINGTVPFYEFPYPDGTDIYISDTSVLFPNYDTLTLNKKFHGIVVYMALSRQLCRGNVHINAQNLGRIWEKLPEQAFRYIQCIKCIVIGRIVVQKVRIYEMRESADARIPPMPKIRVGLSRKSNFERQAYELQRLSYQAKYGEIREKTIIYINKSDYDTRRFKTIFKEGLKHEK